VLEAVATTAPEASVTGDPAVFVSVSAAHQGPDGGGPVAAIIDLGDEPTGYSYP